MSLAVSVTCRNPWHGTETALHSRMSHGYTSSSGGGLGGSGGEGLCQELSEVTRGAASADSGLQILLNRVLSRGEREVIRARVRVGDWVRVRVGDWVRARVGDWVRARVGVRLWEGECWSSNRHTLLAR